MIRRVKDNERSIKIMKRWRNEKEDAIYAMRFASQQMLIDKLQQKNKQLKDNWIDLKEYISIKLYNTEYLQKICGYRVDDINHILLDVIREKMLELEQGSE